MSMKEPLLVVTQATQGTIGKDPLGLGFKKTVHEQVEAVQALKPWTAFAKVKAMRESVQQLESIIEDVQQCIKNSSAAGGSAAFVANMFTLKRQLSSSPGYSSWALRCIADIVDEKLGTVTEQEVHEVIDDVKKLMHTKYVLDKDHNAKLKETYSVHIWGRALRNKYAWSVRTIKDECKKDEDRFVSYVALNLHGLRHDNQPNERKDICKWFLWGLVRNTNRGNLLWVDELEPLESAKKESGRMCWLGLGYAFSSWAREGALELGPVRYCEGKNGSGPAWEWNVGEVVSLDLPKLAMDLVNLRSAMNEKLTECLQLQAKILAVGVSAGVAGFQLLGNKLMASGEIKYVVGNYTHG